MRSHLKKSRRVKIDVSRLEYNVEEAGRMAVVFNQRNEALFPLRINSCTTIYVKKEKCNEEYAESYRKRTGLSNE